MSTEISYKSYNNDKIIIYANNDIHIKFIKKIGGKKTSDKNPSWIVSKEKEVDIKKYIKKSYEPQP